NLPASAVSTPFSRLFWGFRHSRQEQRERSHPTRKNASSAETAPVFRRTISYSQSPHRDTELAHHTDAEGMAESGEHTRFDRADELADGTRWNQMEPNGTVLPTARAAHDADVPPGRGVDGRF